MSIAQKEFELEVYERIVPLNLPEETSKKVIDIAFWTLKLGMELGDRKNTEFENIDFLGQALELESCAKRSESQTAERAMTAAAHTLRKAHVFVTPNAD